MTAMVWDEAKRARNLLPEPEGHGLGFADARDRFEWASAVILPTHASRTGTPRLKAIGFLDDALVTLVFSLLGTEAISAVSLAPPAAWRGRSMTKRKAPPISDAEEARGQAMIARDPDNPDVTPEEAAQAKPASDVLDPSLLARLGRRGRPRSEASKVLVSLRLPPGVVEGYRATGPGWQVRMAEVLAAGLRDRA